VSPSLPVLTTVTARSNVSIRAQTTSALKIDKCPANQGTWRAKLNTIGWDAAGSSPLQTLN
jgi:hypothetical protein